MYNSIVIQQTTKLRSTPARPRAPCPFLGISVFSRGLPTLSSALIPTMPAEQIPPSNILSFLSNQKETTDRHETIGMRVDVTYGYKKDGNQYSRVAADAAMRQRGRLRPQEAKADTLRMIRDRQETPRVLNAKSHRFTYVSPAMVKSLSPTHEGPVNFKVDVWTLRSLGVFSALHVLEQEGVALFPSRNTYLWKASIFIDHAISIKPKVAIYRASIQAMMLSRGTRSGQKHKAKERFRKIDFEISCQSLNHPNV